ncbi:alpha/beta fold hydrolase [Streptomyces rhizosphaericus]|uniref:alpha/beta fold hydrolase n=1 Tax=Streptomyces rhizosphaericus TaxID=114699 RepID=UPI000A3D0949|nr:alpha/beta hydrolase [Streptomyces rhizosphaericus]
MSVVLIHGATCTSHVWGRLTPLLIGDVLAVDLPGRGKRAGVDLRGVTLSGCAQAVADDIVQRGLTDVVLVAHSLGGVVAPGVMSLLPDRIRQVVLLSAVVPDDGTPVADHIHPQLKKSVAASTAAGVYTCGADATRNRLCSDATDDQYQYVRSQIVEDAVGLLTEPVSLAGYRLAIPITYIRLLRDQCYSPQLQATAARRTGGKVVNLDTGHMAMVTSTHRVATILNESDALSSRAA